MKAARFSKHQQSAYVCRTENFALANFALFPSVLEENYRQSGYHWINTGVGSFIWRAGTQNTLQSGCTAEQIRLAFILLGWVLKF